VQYITALLHTAVPGIILELMKKIIITVLTAAFLVFACDNGGVENKNPLIGTWEDSGTDNDGDSWKDQIIFTENEVTKTFDGFELIHTYGHTSKNPINITDSGTYYCTDSTIHFYWTASNADYSALLPIENTAEYAINKNELTLTFPGRPTWTYKKVK